MRMLPVGPSWRPARTVQIVCRAGGAGGGRGGGGGGEPPEGGGEPRGGGGAPPGGPRRERAARVGMLCGAGGYSSWTDGVVVLEEESRPRQPRRARRARRDGQLAQ